MRILWLMLGGGLGLVAGAIAGFGVALAVMSVTKQPNDGTYGMMEVIVCVPGGAVLGLLGGIVWGLRTKLGL